MAATQSDKQQGVSGQTTWGDGLKASTLNSKPGVRSKSLWEDRGSCRSISGTVGPLWANYKPSAHAAFDMAPARAPEVKWSGSAPREDLVYGPCSDGSAPPYFLLPTLGLLLLHYGGHSCAPHLPGPERSPPSSNSFSHSSPCVLTRFAGRPLL